MGDVNAHSAAHRALRAQRLVKRGLDVLAAGAALLLLSPLLAALAIAIRVSMGAPVLFRQVRPGYRGKPFEVVKFRTMRRPGPVQPTAGRDRHADDIRRLSPLGKIMRRTSLDELPQLWNVLRGDMSLVGPRPLLMEYLARYTTEEARRHDVPPGITGWAQIHGRKRLLMRERFALDVWYVDHWSLRLDLAILLATVRQLLDRRGALGEPAADPWLEADCTDQGTDAMVHATTPPKPAGSAPRLPITDAAGAPREEP